MAKTPRAARDSAPHVDPAEHQETDDSRLNDPVPTDAPPAPAEPAQPEIHETLLNPPENDENKAPEQSPLGAEDGSTPRAQTTETLYPDQAAKPAKPAEADETPREQKPDPLLERPAANARADEDGDAPALPGATGETVNVKTSGDFNLMDPFSGRHIDAAGVTKDVPMTQFIRDNLDNKRLELA